MSGADPGQCDPLVLVVDDEEWMRDSCALILAKEGCRVMTASDASAGIKMATEHHPDLVVVDVRMPGMSGLDFLRCAKEHDPDMVAVVVTGYATIDVAVEAMKAGAHEFLPKPFEPDDLRGIVRRGLDRRRLSRQAATLGPEISSLRGIHMAVLVHQLKSPLASLQQCSSVVLSGYAGDIPDRARGMIEVIAKRAEQMISLLNDWLSLVRIEESEALSRREHVDLDALLARVVEDAAAGPDASAVTLQLSRSAGGAHARGDAGMLLELFRNLVTNAIRYTPAGGTIRVFVETEGPAWAVVRVVDDGPGIPPEEQERIFEPFYRGVGQRRIPGDGLGLTISRRIARNHGGELMVRSAVGKGTEFRVVLPASVGEAEVVEASA